MHASKAEVPEALDLPEATWRETEWGEMHVGFETYHQRLDDSPYLEGLPDGKCQCPHWGYVISGRMKVIYADREEEIGSGEAYYLPPGHSIVVEQGTELIEFSPKQRFREHMRAVEPNLQRVLEGAD